MNLFLSGGPSLIFSSRVFPRAALPSFTERPTNTRGALALMIGAIIGTPMDPPCSDGPLSLESLGPPPAADRALELSKSQKRKASSFPNEKRPVFAYAAKCGHLATPPEDYEPWLELIDTIRSDAGSCPILVAAAAHDAILQFEVVPFSERPIRARIGTVTYDGCGPEMKGLACFYTLAHFPQIVERDVLEFMAKNSRNLFESEDGQTLLMHLDDEFLRCLEMWYIFPRPSE